VVVFIGTPAIWTDVVPAKFDIVYSYFPFDEKPNVAAEVPHLAVVLAAGLSQISNELGVLVAYGTSQHIDSVGPCEVLYSSDECDFLRTDTKFDLRRRRWLFYNKYWFVEAKGKRTPKLGSIPEALRDRLLVAQAKTEATQGIPIMKSPA